MAQFAVGREHMQVDGAEQFDLRALCEEEVSKASSARSKNKHLKKIIKSALSRLCFWAASPCLSRPAVVLDGWLGRGGGMECGKGPGFILF